MYLPKGFIPTSDKKYIWVNAKYDVVTQATHDHPSYYGGEDNPYEAIKVIEAWNLGFCLGNTVKYISRAGRKDPTKEIEDLRKAVWYLERHISSLEK
jgi:hypothetical protein